MKEPSVGDIYQDKSVGGLFVRSLFYVIQITPNRVFFTHASTLPESSGVNKKILMEFIRKGYWVWLGNGQKDWAFYKRLWGIDENF